MSNTGTNGVGVQQITAKKESYKFTIIIIKLTYLLFLIFSSFYNLQT